MFGHEIGHIAHRHLVYFGFFILGSLGVLTLAREAVDPIARLLPASPRFAAAWLTVDSLPATVLKVGSLLLAVGGYFLVVFGFLSRRFERQADVFGCRVVSCGLRRLPPARRPRRPIADTSGAGRRCHALPGGHPDLRRMPWRTSRCSTGCGPPAWSWRHGSIVRRIAFLEGLVGRPDAETRFQSGVRRMRRGWPRCC